ncbi:MAG: 2Fe-2S iron-sulfur cluster-binding protein [Acidimicrobiales bacterium]
MTDNGSGRVLELTVNGHLHQVPDRGDTLLGVLRDDLGLAGAKDGCSPQGQCGCCTVLVDGQPRVACVTPARRVRGRSIKTIEGLSDDRSSAWGAALCATGGSQCGFCTPGIVLRLEASLEKLDPDVGEEEAKAAADQALLAHLCRCTGWQTVTDAFQLVRRCSAADVPEMTPARAERIRLEGGVSQEMSLASALGQGGFAADTAPRSALIAVMDSEGQWCVGERLQDARQIAGKIQGRRTTMEHHYPIPVPDGDFVATLQTTWTDPAYLETDASWCEPGGDPATALGNGGAFGAKTGAEVEQAARELANRHGRAVLALYSREDVMRRASKRPPLAAGIRADGSGAVSVALTQGAADLVEVRAPGFECAEVQIPGPPTSLSIRAAVWAELAILQSALQDHESPITITAPTGGVATAFGGPDGIQISVSAGASLDEIALRSYCVGAAHMGWSWVTSEAMTTDASGEIHDLTLRSLGVVRAGDTPPIRVQIIDDPWAEPVNGSDAVFAAAAALAWRSSGFVSRWPVGLLSSSG